MNRREFTKSLAATAVLPALPIPAAAARTPVTAGALRWAAIYLSGIQDKFTPQMVRQITGVSANAANQITRQLVAENLITPAQAAGRIGAGTAFSLPKHKPAVTAKPTDSTQNTLERILERIDEFSAEDAPQGSDKTKDTDNEQA